MRQYYPSPSGEYQTILLAPRDDIDTDQVCNETGLMFYSKTDQKAYVCDGTQWQPLGSKAKDWLFGGMHTPKDCLDAGGSVEVDTDGSRFCRFFSSGTSNGCIPGWQAYKGWSSTAPRDMCCCGSVLAAVPGTCTPCVFPHPSVGCNTGSHSWGNNTPRKEECHATCGTSVTKSILAEIIDGGCY